MDDITENYIGNISHGSCVLGKIIGKEDVANYILQKASECFARQQDNTAMILRDLYKEISIQCDKDRKNYDNKEKIETEESWKVLDEAIKDLNWSK